MTKDQEFDPGELGAQMHEFIAAMGPGDAADNQALATIVRTHNPIDVARAFTELEDFEAATAFDLLESEAQAVVLAEAHPRVQAFLLLHVGDRGSELIASLEPDDAADVLEILEEPEREEILRGMEATEAREIRELTSYGPETAGGIMTPEFVSSGPEDSALQVLEQLRRSADEFEDITNIYVLEKDRLQGVFSLRDLIRAEPDQRVGEIMTGKVITIAADQDQEEALRLMETYHLSTLPVVDAGDRLLGIVTVDDALTAMEEEGSEDVMTLAGTSAGDVFPTHQSIIERVKARLPWLAVTLCGGLGCAFIVPWIHSLAGPRKQFDDDSLYFVMIAGMAGSVGIQSAAVMVRGFATGEIDATRTRRIIGEETVVGAVIGLIVGLGAALILFLLNVGDFMPVTVMVSLFTATTVAAGAGTFIPTFCQKLGVDPAISAGPFLTALNDVLGISIFVFVGIWTRALLS